MDKVLSHVVRRGMYVVRRNVEEAGSDGPDEPILDISGRGALLLAATTIFFVALSTMVSHLRI